MQCDRCEGSFEFLFDLQGSQICDGCFNYFYKKIKAVHRCDCGNFAGKKYYGEWVCNRCLNVDTGRQAWSNNDFCGNGSEENLPALHGYLFCDESVVDRYEEAVNKTIILKMAPRYDGTYKYVRVFKNYHKGLTGN